MNSDFENPFADFGNIVRGQRFIGRLDGLRAVENRVIRPQEPGNLAIIGDYRIGKSSLVYKAVMERRHELLNNKRLPIWINLATYDQASSFFRSLVTRSYDEIEEVGWLSDSITFAASRALHDELSWTEGYGRIQRYFEKIRQAGFAYFLFSMSSIMLASFSRVIFLVFRAYENCRIDLNGVLPSLPPLVVPSEILSYRQKPFPLST